MGFEEDAALLEEETRLDEEAGLLLELVGLLELCSLLELSGLLDELSELPEPACDEEFSGEVLTLPPVPPSIELVPALELPCAGELVTVDANAVTVNTTVEKIRASSTARTLFVLKFFIM